MSFPPLITGFWTVFRVRTWTDHVAVPEPWNTGKENSHRFSANWLARFLFFLHNTHCHYEHHLSPQVPYYNLPALREHLQFRPIVELADLFFLQRINPNIPRCEMEPVDPRDQSVVQLPPDLPLHIELLVRKEVDARVEKEQQFLKTSVEMGARIIGFAAALLVAILTVFGLTTWREIKKETASLVKAQAQELLQKADSETNIKETLNDLLNRTIVASHLAIKARQPARPTELAPSDWDRLRSWIKKEDLLAQDFSDTVSVLNFQSRDRKRIDANRVLSELLNPPPRSPYVWMRKQPEKTASILANFKEESLGPTAVQVVASSAFTDSLRAKAAVYAREVGFSAGVDSLLAAYKKLPWGEVKRNTLVSCVALGHDMPGVVAEVRRLLGEKPEREQLAAIADIIAWMSGSDSFDSELSKEVLLYATNNGLRFEFTVEANLFIDPSDPPPPYISLQIPRSKHSRDTVGRMTVTEFHDLNDYWHLLAELANAGDVDRLVLLLPSCQHDFEDWIDTGLDIAAEPGAKVLVNNGGDTRELDLLSLKGPTIIAEGFEDERFAKITSGGKAAGRVDLKLVGLSGRDFRFALREYKKMMYSAGGH